MAFLQVSVGMGICRCSWFRVKVKEDLLEAGHQLTDRYCPM